MLAEPSRLLEAVPGQVSTNDYSNAAITANCGRKKTATNRNLSLQRRTQFYDITARLILFHVSKNLWGRHAPRSLTFFLETLGDAILDSGPDGLFDLSFNANSFRLLDFTPYGRIHHHSTGQPCVSHYRHEARIQ